MELIVVLDTNAYSDWRRHGQWNRMISTATEVLIPAIVLGELRYGFQGAEIRTCQRHHRRGDAASM